jgi:hypothetical protein
MSYNYWPDDYWGAVIGKCMVTLPQVWLNWSDHLQVGTIRHYFVNDIRIEVKINLYWIQDDGLKVHKIEIFFGFDFEICIISLLVMWKY